MNISTESKESLSRTLLLLRDHFAPAVSDEELLERLGRARVIISADTANLRSESAQHALVTTALLIARCGVSVSLQVPDLRLQGVHIPLRGERLQEALLDALTDLIPGVTGSVEAGGDATAGVVLGDTPVGFRAARVLRIQGDSWRGSIVRGTGARWRECESPFGALAAAGLAAGEVFKATMQPLAAASTSPRAFEDLFASISEASVRLAPQETPPPPSEVGDVDFVSGGAISQAALYALARIPKFSASIRVIEPEASDLSNLNRYALLRRSDVGHAKARSICRQLASDRVQMQPIVERYDAAFRARHAFDERAVLVGVDDIPSRWEVQSAFPRWLGVGGTSHYSTLVSYHAPGLGCAWCMHPKDEPGQAPIPTVSFVSHWAGLWLATYLALERLGARPPRSMQSNYFTSLRADSRTAMWTGPVQPRPDCPFACVSRT